MTPPPKIGVTGESYSGYFTLMAIGKTPDVQAAAVDGIISRFTMLEHDIRNAKPPAGASGRL